MQHVLSEGKPGLYLSGKFESISRLTQSLGWLAFPQEIQLHLPTLICRCFNIPAPQYRHDVRSLMSSNGNEKLRRSISRLSRQSHNTMQTCRRPRLLCSSSQVMELHPPNIKTAKNLARLQNSTFTLCHNLICVYLSNFLKSV